VPPDRQLQLLALVATTACLLIQLPNEANAASVNGARITQVNNHVQLLHPAATARPASVREVAMTSAKFLRLPQTIAWINISQWAPSVRWLRANRIKASSITMWPISAAR